MHSSLLFVSAKFGEAGKVHHKLLSGTNRDNLFGLSG